MNISTQSEEDSRWMAAALRLACRGAGQTWPNPAVGAILVQGSGAEARIVGRAVTASGGRPHAETLALLQAGKAARGATCYVTLEPCSHYAKTPPCVNALCEAGVARVVGAIADPDPRVAGRGYQVLREAGIEVGTGILEERSRWHNRGHLTRITRGRPYTVLKLAISSDGAIGCTGQGQIPITGAEVKQDVHLVRAESDAIMVGVGTVIADNPNLTCRLAGMEHRSPVRVVLDTRAKTPLTHDIVTGARGVPTWILVSEHADPQKVSALRDMGVRIFTVPMDGTRRLCLRSALSLLGEQGLTSILVEGGARLAENLVENDLVDLVDFYFSERRIGSGKIPALNETSLDAVTHSDRYQKVDDRMIGPDQFQQYKRVG